jgi:hypothetical protein
MGPELALLTCFCVLVLSPVWGREELSPTEESQTLQALGVDSADYQTCSNSSAPYLHLPIKVR